MSTYHPSWDLDVNQKDYQSIHIFNSMSDNSGLQIEDAKGGEREEKRGEIKYIVYDCVYIFAFFFTPSFFHSLQKDEKKNPKG